MSQGKTCVRCGLPEDMPGVTLKDDLCSYCRGEKPAPNHFTPLGLERLSRYCYALLTAHPAGDYQAVVAFSGGRDSTYMLYKVCRELGLKTLAVAVVSDFVPEATRGNITRIAERLGADLRVVENKQLNRCARACVSAWAAKPETGPAMLATFCTGCRLTVTETIPQIAREVGAPLMFTGHTPHEFASYKTDILSLDSDHPSAKGKLLGYAKQMAANPRYLLHPEAVFTQGREFLGFNKYDATSLPVILKPFVNYLPWDEGEMERILAELEYDRGQFSGTRRSDCYIAPLRQYLYWKQLGFCDAHCYYSYLVREGRLTLAEAQAKIDAETSFDRDFIAEILAHFGVDLDTVEARLQARPAVSRPAAQPAAPAQPAIDQAPALAPTQPVILSAESQPIADQAPAPAPAQPAPAVSAPKPAILSGAKKLAPAAATPAAAPPEPKPAIPRKATAAAATAAAAVTAATLAKSAAAAAPVNPIILSAGAKPAVDPEPTAAATTTVTTTAPAATAPAAPTNPVILSEAKNLAVDLEPAAPAATTAPTAPVAAAVPTPPPVPLEPVPELLVVPVELAAPAAAPVGPPDLGLSLSEVEDLSLAIAVDSREGILPVAPAATAAQSAATAAQSAVPAPPVTPAAPAATTAPAPVAPANPVILSEAKNLAVDLDLDLDLAPAAADLTPAAAPVAVDQEPATTAAAPPELGLSEGEVWSLATVSATPPPAAATPSAETFSAADLTAIAAAQAQLPAVDDSDIPVITDAAVTPAAASAAAPVTSAATPAVTPASQPSATSAIPSRTSRAARWSDQAKKAAMAVGSAVAAAAVAAKTQGGQLCRELSPKLKDTAIWAGQTMRQDAHDAAQATASASRALAKQAGIAGRAVAKQAGIAGSALAKQACVAGRAVAKQAGVIKENCGPWLRQTSAQGLRLARHLLRQGGQLAKRLKLLAVNLGRSVGRLAVSGWTVSSRWSVKTWAELRKKAPSLTDEELARRVEEGNSAKDAVLRAWDTTRQDRENDVKTHYRPDPLAPTPPETPPDADTDESDDLDDLDDIDEIDELDETDEDSEK